jgi:hypothetical protein
LPIRVRSALADAPGIVQTWIADPPGWLEIRAANHSTIASDEDLDPGELGVLGLAAQRGLLDLAEAFKKIKQTNFRHTQKILDTLLADSGRS